MSIVRSGLLVVLLLLGSGCAGPFPTSRGLTITAELGPDHPGYWTTLQIRWLGTASHVIQLGDIVVLTDPFFTHHSFTTVGLAEIRSDPGLVAERISRIPVADAIFLGHSHYDHLLGVPNTIRQPGWDKVKVYGSATSENILRSFDSVLADDDFVRTRADGCWHEVVPGLEYLAVVAEHAPHLYNSMFSVFAFPGHLDRPYDRPPTRAAQMPVGQTYAYVFRLSNHHARIPEEQYREFVVYFAGAAGSDRFGLPEKSIAPVDVAVMCVPAWNNVTGYPRTFIEKLEPRNVVLSHYDNFFQEDERKRELVPTCDFDGFIREVQRAVDYPHFERIIAPDVGELAYFRKP